MIFSHPPAVSGIRSAPEAAAGFWIMQGTIIKILFDKDCGFIEPLQRGENIWFHRDRLDPELPFDEQLQFRRVEFDIFHGGKRPAAENVRAIP